MDTRWRAGEDSLNAAKASSVDVWGSKPGYLGVLGLKRL